MADAAAVEDLLFGESVSAALHVAPEAAVEAVVAAVAGDLDEAAHEDEAAVDGIAHAAGLGKEVVDGGGVAGGEQVLYVT